MSKFVITTALALVLAGGAYAADHHGGGGGGGGGRGGGGGAMQGGSSFSGGGRGPGPGPSFSSPRAPSGSGAFSNNRAGLQGRTLMNAAPGNRDVRGDERGQYGRLDRDRRDVGLGRFDRDNRMGRDIGHDRDVDFRHHGIVRGDFFEHGRRFHFRRFWHGEWVFLNGWDDCTAWAWIHIAPGVWAWRPIDICIG